MIPILAVPIINRGDLLLNLISSIDYPVDLLYILVNRLDTFDESVEDALTKIDSKYVNTCKIAKVSGNLGVAGSWNTIINRKPDLPYYVIAGNDTAFTPGSLETIKQYVTPNLDTYGCFCADQGFSMFVITQTGINAVGLFDENIYPAYLEDCDYMRRINLSSVKFCDIPNVHIEHKEKSASMNSSNRVKALVDRYRPYNEIYYRKKWGGKNDEEIFTTPYDSGKPLSFIEKH